MPEYKVAGDVTLVVETFVDDIKNPPTRAEAISALQEVSPSYANLEFEEIEILATSPISCRITPDDSSGSVLSKLLLDSTDISEAKPRVNAVTTTRVETTLFWDEEPPEERVMYAITDEAPSSVLNIESVENITIKKTTTDSS